MSKYNRKQGDVVKFTIPYPGQGMVVGCSHVEMPGLGKGWIVEIEGEIPEYFRNDYPFTTLITFDAWICN
jgi:hypothetical protein